jgi:hypothetical protein
MMWAVFVLILFMMLFSKRLAGEPMAGTWGNIAAAPIAIVR